jgi:hypothetical protein
MNTRAILTGIVALFLATGPAHADTLPKEMLGKWCAASKPDSDQNSTYYERKCEPGHGLADGMTLRPNSIEYWEEGCNFTSITPRKSTSWWWGDDHKQKFEHYTTYEIKSKCMGMEEHWNTTIWLTYWPDGGRMEHISYVDNELPFDTNQKTREFCQQPADAYGPTSYWQLGEVEFTKRQDCESKVILKFEKDRYIIERDGEQRGFCRFATINTVWDPKLGVTTKGLGGPVTYITSQCPLGKTTLKVFWSKGSMYMQDVK